MIRSGLASVFLVACCLLMILFSCKPTVPSEFIPEDEMEDILYDYHLADAMARTHSNDYDANLLTYRTAVLKKYGITTEQFDTSMVYYMRHTKQLRTIYERVAQRLSSKAEGYGSSTTMMMGAGSGVSGGDTIDIWNGAKSIALIPNQPYNVHSFTLKPDSSFKCGDFFIMTLKSDFIFQDGMRDGVACLALVFSNDSVASSVIHLSSNSQTSLRLEDRNNLGIKEIKGFFMLNKNSRANSSTTTLQLMALSNIHLFRCHTAPKQASSASGSSKFTQDSLNRVDRHAPVGTVPAPELDSAQRNRVRD